MKEILVAPSACPNCATVLDACSALFDDGAEPSEGDLTVCCKCAKPAQFGKGLKLRPVTEATIRRLPKKVRRQLVVAVQATEMAIAGKRPPAPPRSIRLH